jgi:NADPH:quinone reductase-like Zn-dependent oxidoreductase
MNSTVATRATEIVLPGKVEPGGLQVRSRDLPAPAAGQVMLRMDATGVSFAEQQMRRGKYYDQPSFPFVPGYDVVGTVTAVGPDVDPAMTGTGSSRSPRPAAGPAPCCSTPRTWLPCRTA